MINTKEFTSRLQDIMDYHEETASSFAEKIGVQRSSISHILSGRNKPSLDFVMKVLHAYPKVELYWLLNGKGEFPNSSEFAKPKITTKPEPQKLPQKSLLKNENDIEKIVIFYRDGSFKSYNP